ncbi:MAG TPA: hypothetical protein VI318_16450 [Baekduia sp.]
MSEYRGGHVVLEAFNVRSFAELAALDSEEVIRRLDAQEVPLHPGDKALTVLVLAALADLRRATERLDRASGRLERWGPALAVIATMATVGQLVAALV